jgi:hypothetical protein
MVRERSKKRFPDVLLPLILFFLLFVADATIRKGDRYIGVGIYRGKRANL